MGSEGGIIGGHLPGNPQCVAIAGGNFYCRNAEMTVHGSANTVCRYRGDVWAAAGSFELSSCRIDIVAKTAIPPADNNPQTLLENKGPNGGFDYGIRVEMPNKVTIRDNEITLRGSRTLLMLVNWCITYGKVAILGTDPVQYEDQLPFGTYTDSRWDIEGNKFKFPDGGLKQTSAVDVTPVTYGPDFDNPDIVEGAARLQIYYNKPALAEGPGVVAQIADLPSLLFQAHSAPKTNANNASPTNNRLARIDARIERVSGDVRVFWSSGSHRRILVDCDGDLNAGVLSAAASRPRFPDEFVSTGAFLSYPVEPTIEYPIGLRAAFRVPQSMPFVLSSMSSALLATTTGWPVGSQVRVPDEMNRVATWNGTFWDYNGLTQIDIITSTRTWTKPDWAKTIEVMLIGPGGGGGAGARRAAGGVRTGGGGGGAGAMNIQTYYATDLNGTITVEIGAGGAGGAAVTTNDTNGGGGLQGSPTRLLLNGSSIFHAPGGSGGGGGGGGTGSASGGIGGSLQSIEVVGNGGASSATGGAGSNGGNTAKGPGGGASGGGISSTDVASVGGGSSFSGLANSGRVVQPASGGAVGASGSNGNPKTWARGIGGGAGGGGSGAGDGSSAGGAGGVGGRPWRRRRRRRRLDQRRELRCRRRRRPGRGLDHLSRLRRRTMARYQIIDVASERKLRVIEWDGEAAFDLPEEQRVEPDDGEPVWIEEIPPAADDAPSSISDRQFAQALADLGVISRAEALAFVKRGEVPVALQAAIDAIPDETQRFAADMQVSGATVFERAHPSTLALAHALGWTDAQMDDLWRRAVTL